MTAVGCSRRYSRFESPQPRGATVNLNTRTSNNAGKASGFIVFPHAAFFNNLSVNFTRDPRLEAMRRPVLQFTANGDAAVLRWLAGKPEEARGGCLF